MDSLETCKFIFYWKSVKNLHAIFRGNTAHIDPFTAGDACCNCPTGFQYCDNGLCTGMTIYIFFIAFGVLLFLRFVYMYDIPFDRNSKFIMCLLLVYMYYNAFDCNSNMNILTIYVHISQCIWLQLESEYVNQYIFTDVLSYSFTDIHFNVYKVFRLTFNFMPSSTMIWLF